MSDKKSMIQLVTNGVRSFVTNMQQYSRMTLAGYLDPQGRDLDKECGYPALDPTFEQYLALYERHDIATKVNDLFPDECWSVYPDMFETDDEERTTPFELKWKELLDRPGLNPWYHLHRVDRISGVGQYGVLFMGLDDVKAADGPLALAKPVPGFEAGEPETAAQERRLLFLRPFSQGTARIKSVEGNPASPRYGQPTAYYLKFTDPRDGLIETVGAGNYQEYEVHWSRCLHVADNRLSSEVFGVPRMRPVYNRLLDIRKILGGSAEMFWKGAFPGWAFEAFPELTDVADLNKESIKDELQAYYNGLQRYLTAVGGSWKSLAPQIADPTNHVTQHLVVVAATIGAPLRVLLGSESGHLASTQDDTTWKRRLRGRQALYLDPMVIRPFVHRLILLGVLPRPQQFQTSWTDMTLLSEKDRADVAVKLTQALLQYVTSGAEKVMPFRYYMTLVLGFPQTLADKIMKAVEKAGLTYLTEELWSPTAGNTPETTGTNPDKKTGASGRRNSQGK